VGAQLQLRHRHRWGVTPEQARELQDLLRHEVVAEDRWGALRSVAGVDVGFENNGETTRAAVAVLRFPELELDRWAIARRRTRFPYIPGLLSFRELPAVLAALERLDQLPDLVLCDGQGLAHPRRFGIACHLGVVTDLPTIGVAKSRLIGQHTAVPSGRGSWVPLTDHGDQVGAVVRTRANVSPVFISVGHRITLNSAIDLVLRCAPRFRLPETTRQAHRLASGTI